MNTNDFLVSILAVGNIPYKEDSLSVLEDYLNRHKVRFKIVESVPFDTRNSHPSWWKLLCHKIHKNEMYILNWDLDLLPSFQHTPFHKLDFNNLCMAWDTSAKYSPQTRYNNNFRYNGGLIGIPKSQSEFCELVFEKHAPGSRPSYEQYYLNDEIILNGVNVFEFDDESNFLYRADNSELYNKFLNSNFKHYTCMDRNSLIKEHRKVYYGQK